MNEDYNKDASRLKDLLRGSIVCRSIDDFGACFRGLAQLERRRRRHDRNDQEQRPRRREGLAAGGYMDANVILRFDGFLVEVQLQLEAIYEIKNGRRTTPTPCITRRGSCPCLWGLYVDAFVLKGASALIERVTI